MLITLLYCILLRSIRLKSFCQGTLFIFNVIHSLLSADDKEERNCVVVLERKKQEQNCPWVSSVVCHIMLNEQDNDPKLKVRGFSCAYCIGLEA